MASYSGTGVAFIAEKAAAVRRGSPGVQSFLRWGYPPAGRYFTKHITHHEPYRSTRAALWRWQRKTRPVYRTRFFGHKFELSGLLHAGLLPDGAGLARTA